MDWDLAQARRLYNVAQWGDGYFDVGGDGQVVVYPDTDRSKGGIRLFELAEDLRRHGLGLPCLLRFPEILRHRVRTLQAAFTAAMAAESYQAPYTVVYPIKVNQQRLVVEEILHAGDGVVGLEAGSKPELLAVLAMAPEGGVVVCNGYKDREYIRLALIGNRLGLRVYIVVEKRSELPLILEEAGRLGVRPVIGLRARLAAAGAGKWQNTGGEKSKFGLSAAEILEVLETLKQADALDCLRLLHFHLGSQIPNIQHIKEGMRECARLYAELRRFGAAVEMVDVGGGLGVDYEGTHSRAYCSMNYSLEEYARTVVHALAEVCAEEALPQPAVISESGRALTAHHAVLLTNVIDVEPAAGEGRPGAPAAEEGQVLQDLWATLTRLERQAPDGALEAYHEAVYLLGEVQQQFKHGVLSLDGRARAEGVYAHVLWRVRGLLDANSRAHREVLDELDERLVDKYFGNFSLFQSLPDVWAIDQIFPILPVHRLDEPPLRRARLEDITCDSDGRVDYYVSSDGIGPSLPVHAPRAGEPYVLGFFLVGAYQEILGDMHNLFGDTDSVNVVRTGEGGHALLDPCRGDTVESVLRYVRFDGPELLRRYRVRIATHPDLRPEEREGFLAEIAEGLAGYTYLE